MNLLKELSFVIYSSEYVTAVRNDVKISEKLQNEMKASKQLSLEIEKKVGDVLEWTGFGTDNYL